MGKIKPEHLERTAYVYVRQSSLAQVRNHPESGRQQYAFQERAVRLGWRPEQVEVVDEDQGLSGASADKRSGFQRLVSEVALGRAGAILGLEVSRLARSCSDGYRLLEVAAVAGTLIVDAEGVYDPNQYNDRLLLGLKVTLSEAELHLLKQRMIGGRRTKARRAAFRIRLPVGYVWEEAEGIRMDPDERVREAVTLFFRCFVRLGSALATARYFEQNAQMFPRRDGWGNIRALSWGPLSLSRAAALVHNPVYAGVYTYDRRNPQEEDPEDPDSGGRIWIEGSHSGYITLEQYRGNVARLADNRHRFLGMRRKGSVREGKGLLQGIVLCGLCGRHMEVVYQPTGDPHYRCYTSGTRRFCQYVNGRHVDRLVEAVVLETLKPQELELALGALEKIRERAQELESQWEKRIEAARYEAEKAARRYYLVEPKNRLVVRTLESEWNAKLQEVERLEEQYQCVRQKLPFHITAEQREQILGLAEDLPRLWRAPTTKNSQRKELLRILVEDVTLRNRQDPWSVEVAIRWKTGLVSRHLAERVQLRPHTTHPDVVARIEQLWSGHTDRQIAAILNAEGYRSGFGHRFTEACIIHLRHRRGLKKK